jgi:hypothetical protein
MTPRLQPTGRLGRCSARAQGPSSPYSSSVGRLVRTVGEVPGADAQVVSNCLENQVLASVCSASHDVPLRAIALKMTSSFRVQAVRAAPLEAK